MEYDYPDDDDGDAFRRKASMGCDMTKPMVIDVLIEVPSRDAGENFAELASRSGYRTYLDHEDEDDA